MFPCAACGSPIGSVGRGCKHAMATHDLVHLVVSNIELVRGSGLKEAHTLFFIGLGCQIVPDDDVPDLFERLLNDLMVAESVIDS